MWRIQTLGLIHDQHFGMLPPWPSARIVSLALMWIAAHCMPINAPIQAMFLMGYYAWPRNLHLIVPLLIMEYMLLPGYMVQWCTEVAFNYTIMKMLDCSFNVTVLSVGLLTLMGGQDRFVLPNLLWIAFIMADLKPRYSIRRMAGWLGIKLPTSAQIIIRRITKDGFSLYWSQDGNALEYQIQIDDTVIPTRKNSIKVEGLESGQVYKVIVWSVRGEMRTPSSMLFIRTEHANDEHEQELEQQAKQIRKSQSELRKQMERLQSERKQLESEHQQLSQMRKEKEHERHKLRAQIRMLEDETRQKEAANQKLEQETKHLSHKAMQARQAMQDKITKLQNRNKEHQEQFEEAKNELCRQIEKINQEISKEKQENTQKKEKVEQQEQQLKEQKNILETYTRLSGEMHQLAREKVLLMEQLAHERRKRWD